jgi:glycosyltransferase involved in cell wall biosynthesis
MARHLAIFSANGFAETFTRAHVEWLSPRDVLSGSPYPDRLHGDPIMGAGLLDRLVRIRLTRFEHIDPQQVPFEHYLRTHQPDVLFAEFGTSSADVVEGCARHGVELVGSFYGVDAFEQGLLKKYADRYKRLFGYAKAIMVQSRSIASQLERMGCPAERIVLNPCPPDPSFADLRCDAGSRTICAIGRFVDKKSPVSVALMMDRLVRKAPDLHLVWAGDGPLLPAARELVNALGLSAQVTFVGRVHPEEQKRIMSHCAMLVQHSVTAENGDREGLPVVIMRPCWRDCRWFPRCIRAFLRWWSMAGPAGWCPSTISQGWPMVCCTSSTTARWPWRWGRQVKRGSWKSIPRRVIFPC